MLSCTASTSSPAVSNARQAARSGCRCCYTLQPHRISCNIGWSNSRSITSSNSALAGTATLRHVSLVLPSQLRNQRWRRGSQEDDLNQEMSDMLATAYRAKLKEFKEMMTPEMLQHFEETLSPVDLRFLKDIMRESFSDNVGEGPAKRESGTTSSAEAQQAEQEVFEQAHMVHLPDDMYSYLFQIFPKGTTLEQIQHAMSNIGPELRAEMERLYGEVKAFEQLPVEQMHVKFEELSVKMDQLTARLQNVETPSEAPQAAAVKQRTTKDFIPSGQRSLFDKPAKGQKRTSPRRLLKKR